MKLNRGSFLAAAMVVGALAVTGCNTSGDEASAPSDTTTQASASTTTANAGTTEFARWGRGVRHERGFDHRWGGRHERGRRPWWRFW